MEYKQIIKGYYDDNGDVRGIDIMNDVPLTKEFFKSRPDINFKIIDITNLDFVENRLDYLSVLDEIAN